MTIGELISKTVPALNRLADELTTIVTKYPDLAPQLEPKIAALRAAADPLALASLATTVVGELVGLVKGGITEPKPHPSDLA